MMHPQQVQKLVATQLAPGIRKLADSRWPSPAELYGGTLLRISPIIPNEIRLYGQLDTEDVNPYTLGIKYQCVAVKKFERQ